MKKIPFNENYFALDSERVFYWAGLLAADGCLVDKIFTFKSGTSTHIQEIQLSINDKEIILAFCQDINCIGRKLSEVHYDGLNGRTTNYRLGLKSHTMFDDLLRFGLTPAKSKTLQMPTWLENHHLINHFIRGYFDGDGSIYCSRNSKYIEFRGTIPFLSAVNSVIKNNINIHTNSQIHTYNNCGSLKYSGNNLVPSIGLFMYKNATIWLDRKRQKFI